MSFLPGYSPEVNPDVPPPVDQAGRLAARGQPRPLTHVGRDARTALLSLEPISVDGRTLSPRLSARAADRDPCQARAASAARRPDRFAFPADGSTRLVLPQRRAVALTTGRRGLSLRAVCGIFRNNASPVTARERRSAIRFGLPSPSER